MHVALGKLEVQEKVALSDSDDDDNADSMVS